MKTWHVQKLAGTTPRAEEVPALLDEKGIAAQPIDVVNWADYPYRPKVSVRLAYTDGALLLHYQVEEEAVRGKYAVDNEAVWTDSCVEFFLIPGESGCYYNIETNCIGTVLVGGGIGKPDRTHAPHELTARVDRWASLGREPIERHEPTAWQLALVIPFEVFFKDRLTSLEGRTIRANFYKCGDELPTPHFLSWNPIDFPTPNFHRPDSFGELVFE